ncbi:LysR family transcriptional regulator [Sneathiella chinensis]|uniref:LysR family transcriptional regulator n=1 Tax=Sneathiella chinensis TaxID=349750 RepID=A0ABQ5U3B1_9PROT|nr:LysR family transcriptional regulator [Sneathiella chinensis]GLQ06404.1 LysR family transcriptional regulator [Sneathiella chinensis]
MRIEHLEYFVTVARHGSISGAAIELERNRSTVSMAISALEDELDATLFLRSGNSLELTPAGENILDDCHRLLSLVDTIRLRSRISSDPEQSSLSIGRDDALPEEFWRTVIRTVRQARPDLKLSLHYAGPEALSDLISEGKLDIAYFMPPEHSRIKPGLYAKVVTKIRMQMMIARNHTMARMSYVSDDDLVSLPQITYMDDTLSERFYLQDISNERIALSSFELVRDAIIDGLGWGYVPAPLALEAETGDIAMLSHGLNVTWYPYVSYSREPLSEKGLLGWINRLVYTQMSQSGILQQPDQTPT